MKPTCTYILDSIYELLKPVIIHLGAVYMSPVNRASSGHEILSSAAKEDLNLR